MGTNDFIDDAIDILNKDGRQYILLTMDETGCRYTAHIQEADNLKDFLLDQGFEVILDMIDESKT